MKIETLNKKLRDVIAYFESIETIAVSEGHSSLYTTETEAGKAIVDSILSEIYRGDLRSQTRFSIVAKHPKSWSGSDNHSRTMRERFYRDLKKYFEGHDVILLSEELDVSAIDKTEE
ncbi:hypothetical protein GF380_00975 [Candidatus Uhrbacteria bacterium]|nr:hypothetical protein [Candidatus Uhrbacteria bacterium]